MSKIPIKQLSHIKYKGQWHEVVSVIGHGVSRDHATTYLLDNGDEIESKDIEDTRSSHYLADEDSLEGVLSKVSFDPSHLKGKIK